MVNIVEQMLASEHHMHAIREKLTLNTGTMSATWEPIRRFVGTGLQASGRLVISTHDYVCYLSDADALRLAQFLYKTLGLSDRNSDAGHTE